MLVHFISWAAHGVIISLKSLVVYKCFEIRPLKQKTRFPGAVPQPIGLFLFCIEFGWG